MRGAKPLPFVDLDIGVIDAMLERAACAMHAEDVALIKMIVGSLIQLTALVRERGTTIARLRRLFGLSGSERARDILAPPSGSAGESEMPAPPAPTPPAAPAPSPDEKRPRGHGRIPASDYPAAEHIAVAHSVLHVCR